MFGWLHKLTVQQLQELDEGVRVVIAHPNYFRQHLLLNTFLGESIYIRFEGVRLNHQQLAQQFEMALVAQTDDTSLKHITNLILDECDRAQPQAFDHFLTDVVAKFSGRVLVISRQVPQAVLNDPGLRQRTRFIPVDKYQMLLDYTDLGEQSALLEVFALGQGRVLLNGRNIDEWDGDRKSVV